MAIDCIKNVKISAVCCAVPTDKLTAEDFYQYIDKDSVDRFVKDAGVKQKFYSKNRKTITSDLCLEAAEEIFRKKNIDKNSVDALIFISQSPDFRIPTTSSTLQYRLGLSENCMAYDVNLGCSGYVYGLHLAASKLQSGYLKRVLLLVGDTGDGVSSIPHLNDLLFGDCGSATLIEYEEGAKGFRFDLQTIGSGFKAIGAITGFRYAYIGYPSFDPAINMDGLAVFTFSITKVPKLFKSFLEAFDMSIDTYDTVLLHQANKSMIDVITKKIKAEKSKVPLSLDRYGNTSSATIPNVMCDYYGDNNEDKEVPIIMSGFGIGLSLGIADAYINPKDIFPIISTDITWDEGREKVLEANAKS
ncbi:ketoacyl-ACP synthase III [Aliarcobacter butzleri]|uniref:3-oxoacyl-ACP synthase III family protein n=1 Tax=Aliarcobacter butzleri TaxID=28197 RepID=UPI0021B2152C|nr:ketoacyl-ACP synthase III [Aliarcobacter butzleri]UXC29337.1 ketoacyl-ACP synthase III [Aliarcobacter butzleri]